MSIRNLAIVGIVTMALGVPALAQVTSTPAKKADINKDGVVSQQERQDARAAADSQFKAADTNNDGGLSREELENSRSFRVILRNFDAMDADKDGKVTPAERASWSKARRDAKKAVKY